MIFHADKVHYILDELVLGGLVLETNMHEILVAINENTRLEQNSEEEAKKRETQSVASKSPFTFLKRG